MTSHGSVSRRSFLAAAAATPLAFAAPADKGIPVGIELYSVRDEMAKDTLATVRAIAKMGYQVVEFYGPYYAWTAGFHQRRPQNAGRHRHSLPLDAQ